MNVIIWVEDESLDNLINHVQDLKLMSFDPDLNHNEVQYSKTQNDHGWLQVELNFNDFIILKDNDIMNEHIQY